MAFFILSLAETTRLNGLNFEKYLTYIFSELPKYYGNPSAEELEDYLPWAAEVQARCKQ
ncbi:transposase domain-containing protein [Xylocopilactobacillus apis]|nr:transposase domain-containing protein [Xylocopilactobacillus apis]